MPQYVSISPSQSESHCDWRSVCLSWLFFVNLTRSSGKN
jgi:hypothetical protein